MFTERYLQQIKAVREKIDQSDYLLIGAGAGLSASAGLSYTDPTFFRQHYEPFFNKGYESIDHARMNFFKLDNLVPPEKFWGFWCHHIKAIFYKPSQLAVYSDLYDLVKNKNYFVITTNVDGQFFKGGFDPNKIFSMQGSYGMFQCIRPCNQKIYHNKSYVDAMLQGFDPESLCIRKTDIPRCPDCGELMTYNLRADNSFVQDPYLWNQEHYVDFIDQAKQSKLVLLELGVGLNTPVIIRYPFERITAHCLDATLIRINLENLAVNRKIKDKSITIKSDIGAIVKKVKALGEN